MTARPIREWTAPPQLTSRFWRSMRHCGHIRRVACHTGWHRRCGNDVFRIRRDAMLVQIETVALAFSRDAKDANRIHDVHDDQSPRRKSQR